MELDGKEDSEQGLSWKATVLKCEQKASEIYALTLGVHHPRGKQRQPLPGQFYMLRACKSSVTYGRPISVWYAAGQAECLEVSFLIARRGKATHELCALRAGDEVDAIGPLGKPFPDWQAAAAAWAVSQGAVAQGEAAALARPATAASGEDAGSAAPKDAGALDGGGGPRSLGAYGKGAAFEDAAPSWGEGGPVIERFGTAAVAKEPSLEPVIGLFQLNRAPDPDEWEGDYVRQMDVCLCAGGVGIAPIAFLASHISDVRWDLYVGFKSDIFGLEYVPGHYMRFATEDGSYGDRGNLAAIFDVDVVRANGYKVIYACGPEGMLSYVKSVALAAGVPCYMSLESRMLCGVGACLSCSIDTNEARQRVCKDGPVFECRAIDFPIGGKRAAGVSPSPKVRRPPDLRTIVAYTRLSNPVIAASGTFGYGEEYADLTCVNMLGGICSKGLTYKGSKGNKGVRVIETPSGVMNSIGLENPGIPYFVEHILPHMARLKPACIVNVAGDSIASYVKAVRALDHSLVDIIELNISCPNVSCGGMAFGATSEAAFKCVNAVSKATPIPIIAKLTPAAANIEEVALACVEAGANALSLINTIPAVAIDIKAAKPVFRNVKAGLSGPAVKPIALRMVWDVALAIRKLPAQRHVTIIACGGITTWEDAVEFIMAGASAVEVGSATFANPNAMCDMISGIERFMYESGYPDIPSLCGAALPH